MKIDLKYEEKKKAYNYRIEGVTQLYKISSKSSVDNRGDK